MIYKIFFLAVLAVSTSAYSAENTHKAFSFKNIELDIPFDDFPQGNKSDCNSGKNPEIVICVLQTTIGNVPVEAEYYFHSKRLRTIDVYFNSKNFEKVTAAIRNKYGQEDSSVDGILIFYSAPIIGKNSEVLPDSLALYPVTTSKPMWRADRDDSGVSYALLSYNSNKYLRDEMNNKKKAKEEEIHSISVDI